MTVRIAAASALLVFAAAIIAGIVADNTFSTTVSRGLLAMAGMFPIGLVLAAMAEKMFAENVKMKELAEKSKKPQAKTEPSDR